MKLLSLVTGGDAAFGRDYVLVNLTSNLAQLACRRVAMLKEQKHMDDSLVESYFWDAHAEFSVHGWPNKRRRQMFWLRRSSGFLPSVVTGRRRPPSF